MWKRVLVASVVAALAIAGFAYWYFWHWDDRAMAWPVELPACDGFDFPVGAPDATGYVDERPFRVEGHLGNDWSRDRNGNADVGDPVYAAAAGIVVDARDLAGLWGNVGRVVHGCGVESVYAHLDRIDTAIGATVKRGQQLGTIGTADGQYKAHLHFELRDRPMPLGGGYDDDDATGYLDPTAYIKTHRAR